MTKYKNEKYEYEWKSYRTLNFEKEKHAFLGCVGVGMSFLEKAKVVMGKRY